MAPSDKSVVKHHSRQRPPASEDENVIDISSDDDPALPEASTSFHRNPNGKRRSSRPTDTHETISDDHPNRQSKRPKNQSAPTAADAVCHLEKDLKIQIDRNDALQEALTAASSAREKLQRELEAAYKASDELLKELVSTTEDIEDPQALPQREETVNAAQAFIDALQSDTTCTICTHRLWLPYALSCGHTACQTCIQEWFNEALIQHLDKNPHLEMPNVQPYREALRNPELQGVDRDRVKAELTAVLQHYPPPRYTCPICRQVVKARPTEEVALRSIVWTVAEIQGEENPYKRIPEAGGSIHGNEGIWDGFFTHMTYDLELH
ncbi:uncharacterized protein C8Q71DRAFT_854796 [Rhodofomes roseus]|uniref:RING-type domain-containing protein n=1 Tax=Rhodofomes roseus TaxID=34475 RepID=A0ABQ8KQQ1_9APHY|nr:uncharacterized protein C8Q71DRAFT_854796 [Rhodofomes roseus]KAH9840948.1 hypothetical protein C8Q71DRAFT_854796 [Rhodofomes roseus]